jgi:hypothetical protein
MIDLEDLVLHKVRLSLLWLFTVVDAVVAVVLSIMEPGFLKQFIETGESYGTEIGSEYVLFLAAFFLIPLIMAFLSVTLKDKVNRWANIIMGIAAFAVNFPNQLWVNILYYSKGINTIVYLLIIWYAYRWPKRKE